MGNLFIKAKEYKIFMSGLEDAGKTTILYRLKFGEVVTNIQSIGSTVETVSHHNISLKLWDVGMHGSMRLLMRQYYPNTQALLFVVDSSDRGRLDEGKYELNTLLKDLASAMSVPELTEYLELHKLRQSCGVFATCATTGEGLQQVLDWLECTLTDDRTAGLNLDRDTNSTESVNTSHSTQNYFWKGWGALKKTFVT